MPYLERVQDTFGLSHGEVLQHVGEMVRRGQQPFV